RVRAARSSPHGPLERGVALFPGGRRGRTPRPRGDARGLDRGRQHHAAPRRRVRVGLRPGGRRAPRLAESPSPSPAPRGRRPRPADEALAGLPNTSATPVSVAAEVAGYVETARRFEPPDARYLMNHRGHLVFVKPEERRFVTATLIRETTFTATEGVLKERVAVLRDAGYTQLAVQPVPGQEGAIEDWGRIMHALR